MRDVTDFPMSSFKCRGGNRKCSFTDEDCIKEECEAYFWDGCLVTTDEKPGLRWRGGLRCTRCGNHLGVKEEFHPCKCPKVKPSDPLWDTCLVMNIPGDTTALFTFAEKPGRGR